jgi:hypothetical protein
MLELAYNLGSTDRKWKYGKNQDEIQIKEQKNAQRHSPKPLCF